MVDYIEDMNAQTIDELLRTRDGQLVSIYLPTHPASPEGQQDPIRLKNLLGEAEAGLIAGGASEEDARRLLRPATDFVEDESFWIARRRGLAFFIGHGSVRVFRSPYAFDEQFAVDTRFHVKQLLPLIGSGAAVLVLAVSRDSLRLLEASPAGFRKLEAPSLPRNMEDALGNEYADPGEQVHAGARSGYGSRKRSAVFHGQGGRSDTLKRDLEQYFRVVARALEALLGETPAPVVLAGVKYELPIFRDVCDLPSLASEEIYGSFDHASDRELYEKALPVVRDLSKARQREAASRYSRFADTDRACARLEPLLRAARKGRVETLFLDVHAEVCGAFDHESESVRLGEGPEAEDLLDLLAAETLLHGGDVYAVERNEMPGHATVAGILRY